MLGTIKRSATGRASDARSQRETEDDLLLTDVQSQRGKKEGVLCLKNERVGKRVCVLVGF